MADRLTLAKSQLTGAEVAEYLIEIIQQLPDEITRVISIIGGPASGKSTLVKSLIAALKAAGLAADSISTDDYGLGTRAWRWERERQEPIKLKDFEMLNEHVEAIKQGKTVAVPTYDEATGLAIEAGPENFTHSVGWCDVLFVEGDFDAVEHPDLMIFIDVAAEVRLQARIARDLAQRGEVDAEKVAASFRSRHEKQYLPYTAPAIEKADLLLKVTPTPKAWTYDVYSAA